MIQLVQSNRGYQFFFFMLSIFIFENAKYVDVRNQTFLDSSLCTRSPAPRTPSLMVQPPILNTDNPGTQKHQLPCPPN